MLKFELKVALDKIITLNVALLKHRYISCKNCFRFGKLSKDNYETYFDYFIQFLSIDAMFVFHVPFVLA